MDWYGYSASVSPYILEQFEREAGYKFRPEFIIDQGYYNNQYRVPSQGIQGLPGLPAARGGKAGQGDGGHHPRAGQGGHDVPGRPLDRHRALHGRVQDHRPGRRGGQRGQRRHAAPYQRHSGREIYRGPLSALLLPGHLPRGRRPCAGGQGKLGDGAARHPAQAHRPHRLRRLPEAGLRVPGIHRLCGERVRRVPRAVRQHQGHDALLRQDRGGAELLGQNARLGLPYGAPRAVPEAELQLCGRN